MNGRADALVFVHASRKTAVCLKSIDFADPPEWYCGVYTLIYEDGTMINIKPALGAAFGSVDTDWGRERRAGETWIPDEIDQTSSREIDNEAVAPLYTLNDGWQTSLRYLTTPVRAGNKTVFVWEYKNPYPDKKIIRIRTIHSSADKEQALLVFGIFAANYRA